MVAWQNGVSPQPDYSALDSSPWLHGPGTERGPLPIEDQPEDEEPPVCLPLELQSFAQDLTSEELFAARTADQRLYDISVPDVIWQKAVARSKIEGKNCRIQGHGQKWRNPLYRKKL